MIKYFAPVLSTTVFHYCTVLYIILETDACDLNIASTCTQQLALQTIYNIIFTESFILIGYITVIIIIMNLLSIIRFCNVCFSRTCTKMQASG